MYHYVINLGLPSKYDVMVTIPDSRRESLRILVNMTSRYYAYRSCIVYKRFIQFPFKMYILLNNVSITFKEFVKIFKEEPTQECCLKSMYNYMWDKFVA